MGRDHRQSSTTRQGERGVRTAPQGPYRGNLDATSMPGASGTDGLPFTRDHRAGRARATTPRNWKKSAPGGKTFPLRGPAADALVCFRGRSDYSRPPWPARLPVRARQPTSRYPYPSSRYRRTSGSKGRSDSVDRSGISSFSSANSARRTNSWRYPRRSGPSAPLAISIT